MRGPEKLAVSIFAGLIPHPAPIGGFVGYMSEESMLVTNAAGRSGIAVSLVMHQAQSERLLRTGTCIDSAAIPALASC